MEFSPRMYHWFIRPKWVTKKYIHDNITRYFDFGNKTVLDFGSGTGANCCMFTPDQYHGIDPDSGRIEYARRLYSKHKFSVLQGNELPMENRSIDYIVIIAVLHHIPSDDISNFMAQFQKILKPNGKIIVIEPYLCEQNLLCNRFMKWYDKGEFIRHEDDYLKLFRDHQFDCEVLRRFKKCFLYNELFFVARKTSPELTLI